jgi:hypothetical protein
VASKQGNNGDAARSDRLSQCLLEYHHIWIERSLTTRVAEKKHGSWLAVHAPPTGLTTSTRRQGDDAMMQRDYDGLATTTLETASTWMDEVLFPNP